MKLNLRNSRVIALYFLAALPVVPISGIAQEEDVSFPALYRKAGELSIGGKHKEASETFTRLVDLSGGWETIVEDYGAAAGGMMFDYGMTYLPQKRWHDAEACFEKSIGAAKLAEKISPLKNVNSREKLAMFQRGFCLAQTGDHEGALKLYDGFLASKPSKAELAQVLTSYKLRYGTSQMRLGKMEAGVATIQQLFDNRKVWKVSPAVLAQGFYEIASVWNENARAAGADTAKRDAIETSALAWMDKNGDFLVVQPYEQLRYGIIDRLKPLALGAAKSGLFSLSLRFISNMPTTQQLKDDIHMRTAMLGVKTMPAAYAQRLKLIEAREKGETPPDVEVLRLMAICHERLGNRMAPRTIHWHLVTRYSKLPVDSRAEILHEAAKFSAEMGDFSAAQYFGGIFMDEIPEDHPLRNRVATFMIQALFTSGDHETVIKIADDVRERYPIGDKKRELADMLYPLSLYSLGRYEDAASPFNDFVKGYPESANMETVLYHRASNSLILQKFKASAEQIEEFLKKYPTSMAYLENALSDLAVSRFNLEQYEEAIAAANQLQEKKPQSLQLARTLNVRGDSYMVKANDATEDEKANVAGWRGEALKSYLGALEAGQRGEKEGGNEEIFKLGVAESMWKAADVYVQDENCAEAIKLYDAFFPNYVGNRWEAQISVFTIECLEAVNRGEEGLTQIEKVIVREGVKPKEEQDLKFLREMIGSYSEASVRIRGAEATIAVFNKFPGVSKENQILATWLKIQNVSVMQGMRKDAKKGTPEAEAIQGRISAIFDELATYEKSNLSEYALQQIGIYLAGTENRFLAVPFFEELLNRANPEADAFKGPADFEIGKIEMEDPAKRASARERFLRVINKYKDRTLIPGAWLSLGHLYRADKNWPDAIEALRTINTKKKYFAKEPQKRAESTFLLGDSYEKNGDDAGASQAYIGVLSRYEKYADWSAQAYERIVPISKKAIAALPVTTPEEIADKRAREVNLYKRYFTQMYKWQKWGDNTFETEEGKAALQRLRRELDALRIDYSITPEEDKKIKFDLGLDVEE